MTRCVVNVSTGRYVAGQRRLREALRGENCHWIAWTDEMPPGSPNHRIIPYAFKAYALQMSVKRGMDVLLWADASIVPIRPLAPLWDEIERTGYWFCRCGWSNGEWCSDAALPLLGITREEAFEQPHLVATAFGLDMSHEIARRFLAEYFRLASQTKAFCGPWTNHSGEASADPRVLGHRHDQTAATSIAHKLGMRLTDAPKFFAYAGGEGPETILVADGRMPIELTPHQFVRRVQPMLR